MDLNSLRQAAIDIDTNDFKKTGYYLVDQLAELFAGIGDKPVTAGATPSQVRSVLGSESLPDDGMPVNAIFERAFNMLNKYSLFNGHPKFFGYITSSPAPAGALADLLAAGINPNVGANILSPVATAIEKQTVKWLAEFIGVPTTYGGILVSGGNMANLTAFLAARTAKAKGSLKENGLAGIEKQMVFYCSKATHTWIEKAAVLFGHGTQAIRWVPVDGNQKMDLAALEEQIKADHNANKHPFLVVANAGDVSTGAVDDLQQIAAICQRYDLWFHIDGAYGVPAAAVPGYRSMFNGLAEADSIALDPHKWLYAPLEAGCTLVKNPRYLPDTYSSHPVYYNFDGSADEPSLNFYEYGFQNSRGFRALKVWVALQQAGKNGYIKMIGDDIALSQYLFQLAGQHPELEAVSQNLSITTLRYLPQATATSETFINKLNEHLLNQLQRNGQVFLSNALVAGKYCLRACIVNFRTSAKDIEEVIEIIVREGRKAYALLASESAAAG